MHIVIPSQNGIESAERSAVGKARNGGGGERGKLKTEGTTVIQNITHSVSQIKNASSNR